MKLTKHFLRLLLAVAVYSTLFLQLSWADSTAAEGNAPPVSFTRDILPILSNKCFVCHGPDGTASDIVRLDSFTEATKDLGGYRAIDPNNPELSQMLVRISSTDDPMPPADAEKQLSMQERNLLERWIHAGGEYATHWAFVPPEKTTPPGRDQAGGSDVIDAFVSAGLQQRGIGFAPRAERSTLARRASLVLVGLPPVPERLEAFLQDTRPDAFRRFVDQLLASPHYGEHQARYWLDAVRYGDTHGLHLDNRRGIYPYRDWAIHAINENVPLNDFITWQLAGDLLPDSSLQQLVATGFVRMNPTTSEGGVIPAEFQAKNNFDRVETLGTVLLGMSLTCARCHNHKYDPIKQREYYSLLAFFNNTAENPLDGNKYEYGPVVKAPPSVTAWDHWQEFRADRATLLDEVEQLRTQASLDWSLPESWQSADADKRLAIVADASGPLADSPLRETAVDLLRQQRQLRSTFTTTLVAKELDQPRQTRVLHRGEYNQPTGEPLKPDVFAVMGSFPSDVPRNRLGLARWLTSRDHPLVARVLVNRIWQRTFGEGLVRTPEDFGLQGRQPTHPELLDWLAVELHDSGWDLKHMLRLMVNSRTFQQASVTRNDVEDPENLLLARGPRFRLDAEVIRDVGLWASGLLDPHMGSEGVKPYQPAGLWSALMHPASNTKKYERDSGEKLYRRSLYVYWKRTSPHPMLTLFDAPSRESSCVKRSRTNTSLQSLGLLNETQRIEMARKLAERLLRQRESDIDRLNRLFTLLAARMPTPVEQATCMQLLGNMDTRYRQDPQDADALLSTGEASRDRQLPPTELAAWTQVAATVLASDLAIMLY